MSRSILTTPRAVFVYGGRRLARRMIFFAVAILSIALLSFMILGARL